MAIRLAPCEHCSGLNTIVRTTPKRENYDLESTSNFCSAPTGFAHFFDSRNVLHARNPLNVRLSKQLRSWKFRVEGLEGSRHDPARG